MCQALERKVYFGGLGKGHRRIFAVLQTSDPLQGRVCSKNYWKDLEGPRTRVSLATDTILSIVQ